MKVSTTHRNNENLKVIMPLLARHQDFHQYLDKVAATSKDVKIIDLLIEIRSFNIDCITKYTGLISKQHSIGPMRTPSIANSPSLFREDDMTLWNIHGQLARFMPLYATIIRNQSLSRVYKMYVSNIHDQLIAIKEQLLHPVAAIQPA